MSSKRVIKALSSLGLTKSDIEVFIFLAKEGPHEMRLIAKAFRICDQEAANRLKALEGKGIVKVMDQIVPEQFFAVSFERAVKTLTEANLKQAQLLEENKKIILNQWNLMLKEY